MMECDRVELKSKKCRMDLITASKSEMPSGGIGLRELTTMAPCDLSKGMTKLVTTKIDHPLLVPEILELVFSYMHQYEDVKTIKSICQVNQLWSEMMRRHMRTFVSSEMCRIPRQGEPSQFCKKFVVFLPLENVSEVSKLFSKKGYQIRELNITFKTALEEDEEMNGPVEDTSLEFLLECIERWCPNLETVFIWRNPLDILPPPDYSRLTRSFRLPVKELVSMFWSDAGALDMLSEIARNSPRMQSLTFTHCQVSTVYFVLQTLPPMTLKGLLNLKLIGMEVNTDLLDFVVRVPWMLKFLELELDYSVCQWRLCEFLNRNSGSLQRLKLKFVDMEFDWGTLDRNLNTWVFPVTLNKLQHLELVIHSDNATDCSSFLVNAFHLPRLKSLKVSRPNVCRPLDDNMTRNINLFGILWNSDNTSSCCQNPPCYVQKLSIAQLVSDASIFQQIPNPLFNLKELEIQSMSVDVFLAIFSSQLNLERLTIKTDSFEVGSNTWDSKWRDFPHLVGRLLDWDEILTARIKDFGQRTKLIDGHPENSSYLMLPSTPSLRNLSKLKSLRITPIDTESYLTDFFIYNSLCHLTNLQHISISDNYFSRPAVDYLRRRLVPFCHIDIRCCYP